MSIKPTEFNPDWRVHPGTTIRELFIHRVLESVLITDKKQEQEVIQQFDELLRGEGKITPELDDILSEAFHITPTFFLNLQENYERPQTNPESP